MELRQSGSRALNRLTQAFGFDVRFYGKSFTWISISQASGVLRGVATTFLMARWLPRTVMGEFRYILAMFGLAGIFAASGVGTSIIRGIAKGDTVIVWAGMKRILTIAPLGSLLLLLAAIERWYVGETTIAIALAFSGILFPAYALCGIYGNILTGQERIPRLTKVAVINNALFALCFFLVIWKTKELLPIFFAYLGLDILFRGFLTWNEIRKLPKQGSAHEHVHLSDHLNAMNIVQALAGQLDQLLIQRFAGYGTLANYSIATLIPEQIKDFVNAIGGTMLQRFAKRQGSAKVIQKTRKHFWIMFGLSAGLIGIYFLVAPIAIPMLFPQYAGEVTTSLVYAVGLLAMAGQVGLYRAQADNNFGLLWRYSLGNSVLQIISNIVLIPTLGSWGAILSKTLTRLLSLPFTYPRESTHKNDPTKNKKILAIVKGDRNTASSRYRYWLLADEWKQADIDTEAWLESDVTKMSIGTMLKAMNQADAVYLQRPFYKKKAFVKMLIALLLTRTPKSIDIDDAVFLHSKMKWLLLKQLASSIFVGNEFLMEQGGADPRETIVIPTSIPLEIYSPPREKKLTDTDKIVLGWIGNGPAHKENLKILVQPLKQLQDSGTYFSFVLVGTLGDAEIKDLFAFLGEKFTEIPTLNWSNPKEAVEQIRTWDIGLMPLQDILWNQGKCAFKAIECMALGVPCLMSNVGANIELAKGPLAELLIKDETEWVKKILQMKQADRWNRLSELGRKRVEDRYTIQLAAAEYLNKLGLRKNKV